MESVCLGRDPDKLAMFHNNSLGLSANHRGACEVICRLGGLSGDFFEFGGAALLQHIVLLII